MQNKRGAIGEDKAGVHINPRVEVQLDRCHTVDMGEGRAGRLLEGQSPQPLPHGTLQVHQLHLLRHVLRPPPPFAGQVPAL